MVIASARNSYLAKALELVLQGLEEKFFPYSRPAEEEPHFVDYGKLFVVW